MFVYTCTFNRYVYKMYAPNIMLPGALKQLRKNFCTIFLCNSIEIFLSFKYYPIVIEL